MRDIAAVLKTFLIYMLIENFFRTRCERTELKYAVHMALYTRVSEKYNSKLTQPGRKDGMRR